MTDFNAINNSLNQPAAPATVEVTLVTLGGATTSTVNYGMTISEFKSRNSLGDANIANVAGDLLSNDAIITEDTELFIATPKRNG